jgi:hypothetical protein
MTAVVEVVGIVMRDSSVNKLIIWPTDAMIPLVLLFVEHNNVEMMDAEENVELALLDNFVSPKMEVAERSRPVTILHLFVMVDARKTSIVELIVNVTRRMLLIPILWSIFPVVLSLTEAFGQSPLAPGTRDALEVLVFVDSFDLMPTLSTKDLQLGLDQILKPDPIYTNSPPATTIGTFQALQTMSF